MKNNLYNWKIRIEVGDEIVQLVGYAINSSAKNVLEDLQTKYNCGTIPDPNEKYFECKIVKSKVLRNYEIDLAPMCEDIDTRILSFTDIKNGIPYYEIINDPSDDKIFITMNEYMKKYQIM